MTELEFLRRFANGNGMQNVSSIVWERGVSVEKQAFTEESWYLTDLKGHSSPSGLKKTQHLYSTRPSQKKSRLVQDILWNLIEDDNMSE